MENEEKIKKAITVLDFISQDKQERMLYEARQKAIMDYNSNMFGAREEGRLEGISEGKMEGKMEIVKQMLNKGYDLTTISELTGLEINQLNSLRNSNQIQ